jgi:hypothetical protein
MSSRFVSSPRPAHLGASLGAALSVLALGACDPTAEAAPRVSLGSAPIYAAERGEAPIDVEGVAAIERVRLLVDGDVLGESVDPPFELSFATDRLAEGAHELTAVALSDEGLEGRASTTLIVDRTPPELHADMVPASGAMPAGVQFGAKDESPLTSLRLVVRNHRNSLVELYTCTRAPRVAFTGCGALILSLNAEDAARNHALTEIEYEVGPRVDPSAPTWLAACQSAQVTFPTNDCSKYDALGVGAGTR